MKTARDSVDPVGSGTGFAPEDGDPTQSAAREARHGLRDLGWEVIDAARTQMRSAVSDQQHRVAEEVDGIAEALRHAAQHLDERHQDAVASYAEEVVDWLDGLAHGLRERDPDQLLDETERFARRRPGLFVGGAVAAGFLLVRFIKSSAARAEVHEAAHDRDADDVSAADWYAETASLPGATEMADAARAGLSGPPGHDVASSGSSDKADEVWEAEGGSQPADPPARSRSRSTLPPVEADDAAEKPSAEPTPHGSDPGPSSGRVP